MKGLKSKYIRLRYDHSKLKGSHLEVYMGHHHIKINQIKGLKSKDIRPSYEYIKPQLVTDRRINWISGMVIIMKLCEEHLKLKGSNLEAYMGMKLNLCSC